jgi:hypothetical protein
MRAVLVFVVLILLPVASWAQDPHAPRPMGDYKAAFDAEWDAQSRRLVSVRVSRGYPPGAAFTILGVARAQGEPAMLRSSTQVQPGARTAMDQTVRRDWASLADCPALRARLEALETIDLPRPRLAPRNEASGPAPPPAPPSEVLYTLDARGQFSSGRANGTLRAQGFGGSPLESWMEETEKALTGCWKPGWP